MLTNSKPCQTLSWKVQNIYLIKTLLIVLTLTQTNNLVTSSSYSYSSPPVVAILSQPNSENTEEYIAASYVKWLESQGAKSIPLHPNADNDTVDTLFHQVNGFLMPGGGSNNDILPPALRRMWDLALKANIEDGDYFPVWGTCLGFEQMISLVSESGTDILQDGFQTQNISLSLNFTSSSILQNSTMFANPRIQEISKIYNITMNAHQFGVTPYDFYKDENLPKFFTILSTNRDPFTNKEYISSIEHANKLPIFGVQWHPEKNNFEYATTSNDNIPYYAINHSPEAIELSLEMSRVFVTEMRKSKHVFEGTIPLVLSYEVVNGNTFEERFVLCKKYSQGQKQAKRFLKNKISAELCILNEVTNLYSCICQD